MNRRASLTAVAAIVVLAPDATLAATLDGTAMRRPSSAQAAKASGQNAVAAADRNRRALGFPRQRHAPMMLVSTAICHIYI
jgi:hypothetical protein